MSWEGVSKKFKRAIKAKQEREKIRKLSGPVKVLSPEEIERIYGKPMPDR